MKRIALTGSLLAGLVALQSCLFGSTSKVEYEGRHVSESQMRQVEAGVSKQEVLQVFGEPTGKSDVGDAAELWTWRYTRKSESSSSVFLLLASKSEVIEHGTVYVRLENDRVAKVWRTEP